MDLTDHLVQGIYPTSIMVLVTIQKTAWDITASARNTSAREMWLEPESTPKKNSNRSLSEFWRRLSRGRRPREQTEPSVIEQGLNSDVIEITHQAADSPGRPVRHGASDELEYERSSGNSMQGLEVVE